MHTTLKITKRAPVICGLFIGSILAFPSSLVAQDRRLPPLTDILLIISVEGIDDKDRLRMKLANDLQSEIKELRQEREQKGNLVAWKSRELQRLERDYEQCLIPLGQTEIFDTEGKEISIADARKMIESHKLVIITPKNGMFSREHAARIRKGTLIFAGIDLSKTFVPVKHFAPYVLTSVDGIGDGNVLQFSADIKKDSRFSMFFERYLSLKHAIVFDTEGTRISVDESRRLITPGTSIVITSGGMMPHAHAELFNKRTLIFVWPASEINFLSGKIGEILTRKNYDAIKIGMSYAKVQKLLFSNDATNNHRLVKDEKMHANTVYRLFWADAHGNGIGVVVMDGKVVEKFEKKLSGIEDRYGGQK